MRMGIGLFWRVLSRRFEELSVCSLMVLDFGREK